MKPSSKTSSGKRHLKKPWTKKKRLLQNFFLFFQRKKVYWKTFELPPELPSSWEPLLGAASLALLWSRIFGASVGTSLEPTLDTPLTHLWHCFGHFFDTFWITFFGTLFWHVSLICWLEFVLKLLWNVHWNYFELYTSSHFFDFTHFFWTLVWHFLTLLWPCVTFFDLLPTSLTFDFLWSSLTYFDLPYTAFRTSLHFHTPLFALPYICWHFFTRFWKFFSLSCTCWHLLTFLHLLTLSKTFKNFLRLPHTSVHFLTCWHFPKVSWHFMKLFWKRCFWHFLTCFISMFDMFWILFETHLKLYV